MHRSRLGTIVIDCRTTDLDAAARCWSEALGRPAERPSDPANANFRQLRPAAADDLNVLVQAVEHPSRAHVDIETDDLEAEVQRLERLGAKRVAFVKHWWVMEAPTGQRFCVVPPQSATFGERANQWPGE